MQTTDERPLLPWRQQAFPVDWSQQFSLATDSPLHLEVGFGDGRYTTRRAKEFPDERFVALEISSASVMRGVKRVHREGVTNVRLMKAAAAYAVRHLFAPHSLTSITVNFPDPWPKERHEKNRLLQDSFFRLAASRLKPGGAILLATDHPDYLAFAQAQSQLSGLYTLEDAEPPEAVFETKYALKWKSQGKPLYYQVFRYNGAPTDTYPIFERSNSMPHALLTGELPESFTFEKQVIQYADGHVILHEVAKSYGNEDQTDERWLARITTDEPDLKQQLLVIVQRRTEDELIVRLESFGDPVITKTVRGAVHVVTEWLLGLSDSLALKERNY